MRLLLDTHIYIALLKSEPGRYGDRIRALISAPENDLSLSVATSWEMSIKWRLGKLDIQQRPEELAFLARSFDLSILPITEAHVVAELSPEPPTRDPFDRLLLAQCAIEGMRLVTIDQALVGHPLAIASPA